MIFSSLFFMFVFLPLMLLVYFVVPWKIKNLVILMFSLVFYAWGEPVYVILMIFSILINYVTGLELEQYRRKNKRHKRRMTLIFNIVVNLGILGFFKYYGFFVENLNAVLPFDIPYKELALPVGISFYTFQTLSYILDLYWERVEVQTNLVNFAVYVTMFPQLIAGPIVRYADVAKQLAKRTISLVKCGEGCAWFLRGLAKKVLFANNIGMLYDTIAALPANETPMVTAWLGAIAYTFQIYFDFGGYSDMAIGLGKMLGFDFVKNFDYPYISRSVTEFWRRWHISLGTWFREYVYIPLGGNRVGTVKHIRNIMVVWLLTGFWHGAAWNFMLWGIYYGALLLLEKYFLKDLLARLPGFVQNMYAMILVIIGWVFFFSPTVGSAFGYIGRMFGIGAAGFINGTTLYYLKNYGIWIILMIFFSAPFAYNKYKEKVFGKGGWRLMGSVAAYVVLFIVVIAFLVNATYNPFLYFRF